MLQWDEAIQKAAVIELGHIDNKKQGRMKHSHGRKLLNIFATLKDVFNRHPEITTVVRERGVTRFNKATQVIFRVVGVADLLTEMILKDSCHEIGISEAKKAITGSGKAEKEEVAEKVQKFLTNHVAFAVDDESDAVAVGVAFLLKQGGN